MKVWAVLAFVVGANAEKGLLRASVAAAIGDSEVPLCGSTGATGMPCRGWVICRCLSNQCNSNFFSLSGYSGSTCA